MPPGSGFCNVSNGEVVQSGSRTVFKAPWGKGVRAGVSVGVVYCNIKSLKSSEVKRGGLCSEQDVLRGGKILSDLSVWSMVFWFCESERWPETRGLLG